MILSTLRRMFSREKVDAPPQRVFVIYAHATDGGKDTSTPVESFHPIFFPSDKVGDFSIEEFSSMAKVFRKADDAVNYLYRCKQWDCVPCIVYVVDEGRWIQDGHATDFFHDFNINY